MIHNPSTLFFVMRNRLVYPRNFLTISATVTITISAKVCTAFSTRSHIIFPGTFMELERLLADDAILNYGPRLPEGLSDRITSAELITLISVQHLSLQWSQHTDIGSTVITEARVKQSGKK